jgi:mannose-6-phosphate isomerase-like protein (cupin superfamily)
MRDEIPLFTALAPDQAFWRPSNLMKIPNTNLAEQLGAEKLGMRLWRLPPRSANTWHKHLEQEEIYFVLEGTGRMRVGKETLTVPRHGAVRVGPAALRQVFNDTAEPVLWLIVAAPRQETSHRPEDLYPEPPTQLPPELSGSPWPPK